MKKVLSTKTLDRETLAYAQTQNLDVQCMDFIETTAFPFKPGHLGNKSFDALAFTSANAVKYFFEDKESTAFIQDKLIFAIQGKTQEELLVRDIKADITATSAHELAIAIIKSKSSKNLLHVCGNLRLPVLEDDLYEAGILYTDLMVYQTGTKAKKIEDLSFDAILFYSPSGVESFFALNNPDNEIVCCCIGQTTAQALKEKKNAATIILPAQPSPLSMISAVAEHLHGNIKKSIYFTA